MKVQAIECNIQRNFTLHEKPAQIKGKIPFVHG